MKKFTKSGSPTVWARVQQMLLIMKFTTLLLLLVAQASASVYSQKKISIRAEATLLDKMLIMLEKKSNYRFFFNNDELKDVPPVSIDMSGVTVTEALDRLLLPLNLHYKVLDNNVVVVTRAGNEIRDKHIKGKVVNAKGEPLPGVTVKVSGANAGAVTNAHGEYELNAPDNATLVFSFIGHIQQTVAVEGRTTVNITLQEDTQGLNEVVVVGYGSQKKGDLTGAVATLDGKKLESRPLVNLAQGLQGMVPNLNVNLNNGAPGKGATFNVRGNTSINGGGPLVLVDGVQMDPNLINPADVANVTVLKDAASAAIYGVRGAYGVILITTKKPGKDAPLRLNYSTSYTITRPTRMPKYLNSVDYIRMHREADRTGQLSGGNAASEPFTTEDSVRAAAYFKDPANNLPVYVDPANPSKYRYVGNTDWIKELYPGWAPMMDHNVSISGGQGKTGYVASLGYFDQKGLLKVANEDFKRYNASLKLNTEATSWLELNMKMMLNRTESNKPTPASHGGLSSGWISGDLRPIMPVYHPDGHFSGQGSFTNIVALATLNGRTKETANDLWLTGGFVLKPVKNLRIVGDYTWNSYNLNNQQHYKEYQEYGANGILLGTFPWSKPSSVKESNNNDYYMALNAYAEYSRQFGQHFLKAMVGYNQEKKQVKGFNVKVKNLIDQTMPAINLNNDNSPLADGRQYSWALAGSFFRLNYDYANKYLLEVNGRYDGTSRFPANSRYVFLPSVSAGWRVSEEGFFKPLLDVVNDLKLRASYGTLGNQALNPDQNANTDIYPYIPTMPGGKVDYIFDDQKGVYVGVPGLVSQHFTWEKVSTRNFGLDVTLLKNRLSATFDWYIRDTKDMLLNGYPLPGILGTSAPKVNTGEMRTKGWELGVNWRDKINDDLSYEVNLALSDYSATITRYDLNPTKTLGSNTYYVGQKLDEIWGYVTDGFFQSDAEAAGADQSNLWNGKWLAGDIRFKDLNGDKKITSGQNTAVDPGDRKVIGNKTPRYQFGLNLSVQYKNFDFNMLIQGVGKRDVMLDGNTFWGFKSEWDVPMVYQLDYWTPETPNAYYPRQRFGGGGNFQAQTKYLQHAAYARMKNLSIGYTLPATAMRAMRMQKLRVYVSAQNLFEVTRLHKAYDPEIFDAKDYPLNRAISFGLQLGL
ncbi:SusC/RagA family TonB-linked outer membrane protein [Chitinophaga varians]|uniref:SusC/RagA family TonB-linked outer membrane protein n=1 Tax=Chitinophaga varians TaxID=2202339 RepID=UPI001CB6D2A9|nr:TonB-dependent receptor [Chitinophaga varians]